MNIREIRKKKKLTQDELAERSKLQTSFLAGVERGERNITLQTLEKIIDGLEINVGTIFNYDSINIEDQYLDKKEVLDLLDNILNSKSEQEIKLIYKITKEIFTVYEDK